MTARVPVVLAIAGTDPSGGAGVLADARAIAAHGAHACAVVAAVTAQSTREVRTVRAVPAALLRQQLDTLLEDVAVDAVKVGLLGSVANVRVVAEALAPLALPVVLDPVLRATAGRTLTDPEAMDAIRALLLPLAAVATPNAMEAGALLASPAPATPDDAGASARALVALGARAALVTGGHVDEGAAECVDVLATAEAMHELRVRRVPEAVVRGTGCLLSSAIAARLARGESLHAACAAAQRWVAEQIARAIPIGNGPRVAGADHRPRGSPLSAP